MKNILYFVVFIMASLLITSCEAPVWPSDDSVVPGSNASVSQTNYDSISIPAVNATLNDSFIRGIDASEVKALEESGITFYDEDNSERDVFAILADHGVNWIRLRIWNDYTQALTDSWGPYGYNDLSRTIDMAKRAKKYGMKILLDFHYSDTWTDPGNQKIPAMWASIDNVADLAAAVASWTNDILVEMKSAGCAPDMVQLGNEMEGGLFATGSAITSLTTANIVTILNAAADAVDAVLPDAEIMLHMSRGGNSSVLTNFYNNYVSKVTKCDVIGLSYYPYFNSHGTIAQLQTSINTIVNTYGKKAVVAEISYGYSTSAYTDSTSNTFWTTQEVQAATQLTTMTPSTNSDGNSVIAATVQNQANVIREVIEKTADKGCSGIFYWGACYLGIDNVMPSSWENQALFDANGKALPSLKVMNVAGK